MSPRRREGIPTPRRVVAMWTAVAVAAVAALVALSGAVGLDHPLTGPVLPEAAVDADDPDPLRDELTCPDGPTREGSPREPAPPTVGPGDPAPVEVTSNQLYDCPQAFDGRRVRYTGEVVGALLHRDDGVWVQLNDDVYGDAGAPLPQHRDFRGGNAGVGALLPPDLAAQITWVGRSGVHGDVLEVTATFHRVDASGEVAVLRVEQAAVARDGRALEPPPARARSAVAVAAALVAVGVAVLERRTRATRG